MFICLFICMRAMAGRTAGPIKTKLGMGTHVDPGSVLGKVKVMWHHLANANKTPYRGPQGPTEFERPARADRIRGAKRDKYLAPPGECQFFTEARLQLINNRVATLLENLEKSGN